MKISKIISLLLTLCMLLSFVPAIPLEVSAENTNDPDFEGSFAGTNLSWKMFGYDGWIGNKQYTLYELWFYGSGRMPDFDLQDNRSPFLNNIYITDVFTNGSEIENFGAYSFYGCENLGSVTYVPTITEVGDYAFYHCRRGWSINQGSNSSYVAGVNLQRIGAHAFDGSTLSKWYTSSFTSDSVEYIGDYAFFNCRLLDSVTLNGDVEYVGEYAFASTGLTDLTFPSYETASVAPTAFLGTDCWAGELCDVDGSGSFGSLNWEYSSATHELRITGTGNIPDSAFANNANATYICIDDSVVGNIGESAFENCKKLEKITIGDGIRIIDEKAFYKCKALREVEFGSGVTQILQEAFCECESLESLNADRLVYIAPYAFMQCKGLKEVRFGDSLTQINYYAFADCSSLERVKIGNGLKTISRAAFGNCLRLQVFDCDSEVIRGIGINQFDVGFPKFYGKTNTMLELFAEAYGVEFYPTGEGHADLEYSGKAGDCDYNFDIETGILTYSGTGNLFDIDMFDRDEFACIVKEIVIEEGPTEMLTDAISYFPLVESVVIPNSVEIIEGGGIRDDDNLKSIIIGTGVRKIKHFFIYDCKSLKTILVKSKVLEEVDSTAFQSIDMSEDLVIYGAEGSPLEERCNEIKTGDYTEFCRKFMIRFCPLPDEMLEDETSSAPTRGGAKRSRASVAKSGDIGGCHWMCDGSTLTVLGAGAIPDYDSPLDAPWASLSFNNVEIGEEVYYIGKNAFTGRSADCITILNYDCEIYDAPGTLGTCALVRCPAYSAAIGYITANSYSFLPISEGGAVGSLNWYFDSPSGTLTIAGSGDMPFSKTSPWSDWKNKIRRVVIADGVTSVGAYSFDKCKKLTEVRIAPSVRSIGTYSFARTASLRSVTLPEGVESIYGHAFYDSGLTRVTVPRSATTIVGSAFGFKVVSGSSVSVNESFVLGSYDGAAAQTSAEKNGLLFIDREKYCLIQFESNGGTGSMDYEIVEKNKTYYFPECAYTAPAGKDFCYWIVNDTAVNREGFLVTHDCVVKPKWDDPVAMNFDPGDGSGSMDSVVFGKGRAVTIPECTFTAPEGWSFAGWKVGDPAHGYTFYEPGDPFVVTNDTTFIARWENSVRVILSPGKGKGDPVEYSICEGAYTEMPSAFTFAPPESGYELAYWQVTDANGRDFRADPGDIVRVDDKPVYAKAMWWMPINFDGNGGSVTLPSDENATHKMYGKYYILPSPVTATPPEPGLVFAGWDIGQPGDMLFWITNPNPRAQWVPRSIRVSFSAGAGTQTTALSSGTVTYGDEITLPECPYTAPAGTAFVGWQCSHSMYASNLQPGQTIRITYNYNGQMTFTAQYSGDMTVHLDMGGHEPIGGAITADRVVPYGGYLTDLPDGFALGEYILNGYIFRGWYYDTGFTSPFDPTRPITNNLTLYAKWEEGYTVTFWKDGSQYARLEASPNGTVTPPSAPVVSGADFVGWYDPATGGYLTGDTVIDGDKNVHAEYRGRIIVDFDDWNETELVRGNEYWMYVHIEHDELLPGDTSFTWTCSDPSVMEILGTYEAGWSNNAHVKIADDAPFDSTVTLTFTAGDYSASQTYHVRAVYPLTVNEVEVTEDNREDVLGDGNISFDGADTLVLRGGTYLGGVTSRLAELTIDVQSDTTFDNLDDEMWTPCRFDLGGNVTVTGAGELTIRSKNTMQGGAIFFDGEDLVFDNARVTVESDFGIVGGYGETLKNVEFINSNVVLDTDYEALKGFDGSIVLSDSVLSEPENAAVMYGGYYDDDNMRYYPKVVIRASAPIELPVYTVSFVMNGFGDQISPLSVEYGRKAEEPDAPYETGYDFCGWYTDAECTKTFDFDTGIGADITLYAKWTTKNYNVIFRSNGMSEAPAAQSISYRSRALVPAEPEAEEFVFGGWYSDPGFEREYDFDAPVTSDVSLYAKWTIMCSVSFSSSVACDLPAEQEIVYGEKATEPADPVSDSFIFAGWYEDELFETEFDFDSEVTSDIVLYAKWGARPGDANADGAINTLDLTLLRQYLADPTTEVSSGADANCDGALNTLDLTLIRQYLADPTTILGA